MPITITPVAAERVRRHLAERGSAVGLRLGLRKSGCSGYAYAVDYADEITAADSVFEDQGVKLVIAVEHLPMLDGVRVDYVREGLNEKFVFDNPNVGDTCGCGSSFTVRA